MILSGLFLLVMGELCRRLAAIEIQLFGRPRRRRIWTYYGVVVICVAVGSALTVLGATGL